MRATEVITCPTGIGSCAVGTFVIPGKARDRISNESGKRGRYVERSRRVLSFRSCCRLLNCSVISKLESPSTKISVGTPGEMQDKKAEKC